MNGQILADIGIQTARQHAEVVTTNWTESILSCLEDWAEARRHPFALEDFRAWIEENRVDLIPPSPQAWGSVSRIGMSRKIIRWTRTYRPARSPATRGHPVRVFVRSRP